MACKTSVNVIIDPLSYISGLMYISALNRLLSAGLIFAYIRLRSARSLAPAHKSLKIQPPTPSPEP